MPAIGGRQVFTITYRDHTGELSTFTVYFDEITSISLPGLLTQLGALADATDAITLGDQAKQSWGEQVVVSNSIPANKAAQRENKLLVQYQGAVTQKPYTLTIPTVDLTKLNFVPNGGDAVIFEGGGASSEITAWVTAFEALASAPDDEAENVVVTGMRFVGRNN